MGAGRNGTSFVKTKRMQGLTALLTSAACEWFLIFLLLVDSALSYLVTKFASYCQLQLPCLLCSRLDHVLGFENRDLYHTLFCSDHKSEISSLVLCHVHGKLADGHKMCDDCLLSLTVNAKCNTKSHRLLMGKFGLGHGGSGFQNPSLSKDLFTSSKGSRQCVCCGKVWKSEQNSPRSIQLKSTGRAVLKPYIPLPNVPRQSRLNTRDNLKKTRDTCSGLEGKRSFHPLSHVGYTKLRLNSDSESEFPFSDDDDVSSVFQDNIEAFNDSIAQTTSVPTSKCTLSDTNLAKEKEDSTKLKPSSFNQHVEPNISKQRDVNNNHSVEINWQEADQNSSSCDLPELISLDEDSQSPITVNVSNGESQSIDNNLSQNSHLAPLSELMTLNGVHPFIGLSSDKSDDVTGASDAKIVTEKLEKVVEMIGSGEKASTETDVVVCDSGPKSPKQENSSNASNSPVITKKGEVPGFVIEKPKTDEIDNVKEELKLPPSRNSSFQASNMPSVDKVKEELKLPPSRNSSFHSPEIHAEISSSNGIQVLPKTASYESGLESLDGSSVAEIEGESTIDRLNRQIEYYKKCMESLHKELEEERNASAIATNEAMSMITRLQEEKAALQMEALQYLRMMEEQAEYDNDELEKVNDLLTEKEKEIQDLEAELEFYKLNMTDEPMVHNMHKDSWGLKEENVTIRNAGVHNVKNTISNFPDSKFAGVSKVNNEAVTGGTSILEFEEEKLYISQCLKNLENKVHQISYNGISCDSPNNRSEKIEVSKFNQQGASSGEGSQLDGEVTDSSINKNIKTTNVNHSNKNSSASSEVDDCSLSVENNHSTSVGPVASSPKGEVEVEALENEISDLNDRLEALEFDHGLLEHIMNSLQNGNDGKQFIEDIAHKLHELREIGIKSRW